MSDATTKDTSNDDGTVTTNLASPAKNTVGGNEGLSTVKMEAATEAKTTSNATIDIPTEPNAKGSSEKVGETTGAGIGK